MTTQERLVQLLDGKGALSPEWRDAVMSVDRGLFIPSAVEGCGGTAESEEWRRLVYDDVPVVTQVNDGMPIDEGAFRLATSSSSMPSIMLEMLDLLDARAGDRVLELGTGTGYNAAWLSHRLGDANVATVELDPVILATAVNNLKAAGYCPTATVGDGRDGFRRGAPYQRIICTFSMREIPRAWLEQCLDGRIVTPWGSSFFNGSFVTLAVEAGRARGSFSGDPAFMWDRKHRAGAGRIRDHHREERGRRRSTDVPPQNVLQDDPAFFVGLHLTDAWYRWAEADDGSGGATLWLFADDGKSWASVRYAPDQDAYGVEQFGPRTLWDETESAFLRWHELGKPERSRFGISVDARGQRVWLDDPLDVVVGVS
ncbi:methyltransferase domain-containing protein [Embleya sp. NBC_00896]|uniref:methyltransferase domain-containing protein n=1 Tax=Embleya sp. NBC_00896 TaxID=2975961 RepID=UPI003869F6D4|nr:methyltransferase domain-containing protein [Embleya sp. NBC_00896]